MKSDGCGDSEGVRSDIAKSQVPALWGRDSGSDHRRWPEQHHLKADLKADRNGAIGKRSTIDED